jgi:hypothetical protein
MAAQVMMEVTAGAPKSGFYYLAPPPINSGAI